MRMACTQRVIGKGALLVMSVGGGNEKEETAKRLEFWVRVPPGRNLSKVSA